jgi:hypothetical protein
MSVQGRATKGKVIHKVKKYKELFQRSRLAKTPSEPLK